MASLLKWLGDAAHNVQKIIGDIGHNVQQGAQQANNFVARPVQQAVRAAAPVAQQVVRASIPQVPQIPKAPDFINELGKIRINPNTIRQAAIDTVNPKVPFTNVRSSDIAQGVTDFVLPNTRPFVQKMIPTLQSPVYRGQYITSQLAKPFLKLQGIYNDPGFAKEYDKKSLEALQKADELQKQGYVTDEIANGNFGEFTKQMFKTGVPVGLDIGSTVSGAQLAGVPLKKAAIEGGKEALAYGTGLLVNKGLQNGKIELKDIPESYGTALANEIVGFGAGKVLGKITNKFKPNSIKEIPDFNAPISVPSLAEKGRLLEKGYKNIDVKVPQDAYGVPGQSFTNKNIDTQVNAMKRGDVSPEQARAFVIDDYQQKFGKNPSEADIQGLLGTQGTNPNLPEIRNRTQLQAQGIPLPPKPVYQDVPDIPQTNKTSMKPGSDSFKTDTVENIIKDLKSVSQEFRDKVGSNINKNISVEEVPFSKLIRTGTPTGKRLSSVEKLGSTDYVTVIKEGNRYRPVDGQHRIAVAENSGKNSLKMIVANSDNNMTAKQIKDQFSAGDKPYILPISNSTDVSKLKNEDLQYFSKQGYTSIVDRNGNVRPIIKEEPKYRSRHQIDSSTSRPIHTVDDLDNIIEDVKSKYGLTNYDRSDIAKLKKIQQDPNMDVKIYRASPVNELNDGDWVTTSKIYANDIKQQNGGRVYEYTVKAKELNLPKNINDNPSNARFAAFQYGEKSKSKPIYELAPKPGKIEPEVIDGGLKQRGVAKSLQESGVSDKIYADIPGYKSVPNQTLLNISENRVALNEKKVVDSIKNRQPNQPITAQLQADSVYLLNKYVKEGRDEEALAIARATAKNSTEAGRAVQILSKLHATTPEGAIVRAQKMVDLVNKKAKKIVATLTPENQAEITRLANEVQKYKQGTREWDVAAAMLAKYVDELAPVGTLKKISSIQTMAQLLNPKTAIRNIIGNVGMAGAEDLSSIPATIVDKVISKMAGTSRTTAIANPIVRAKGTLKGAKYGYQDALAGIKTSGLEGKFEVQPDVFKKGVMKKLQTALSVELGAADKAFYTGQFDTSLNSIMRANKTNVATKDMLEQANQEALYATFQNNSLIAQGLQKAKGAFNAGKDWGVGDLIIKYPKTPGNIVSVGLDYSPVGAFKGLKELVQNWSNLSPSVQRDAVKNIGRSITGTGAITLGYVLAKNNIITGKRDSDKDIANLDQQEGVGPFSFNFTALKRFLSGGSTSPQEGDVVANYDWMQPAAISLSMGANMAINGGKNIDNFLSDAIESVGDAANTITEQPVLKGIRDFAGNLDTSKGGGFGKATERLVSGIPASFVPSLVNQSGQLTDNTARSRYSPSFVDEMINSVKARIPGARNTLQPVVTTLGQEKEQYQDGSNNLFNVLINPAFVKVLKGNPVYDLVKGIQDRTGETTQAPRTAPYKVKINGEQRELQPAEYTQYQTYVGKKTNETYMRMAQDPQFNALSDEEKAKKMSNVMSDINSAALIELFGNQPKTIDKNVKEILATGSAKYSSEDPEVAKSKKVAVKKAKSTKKSTKKKSTGGKKKGRKTKSGKQTVASIPNVVKSGMFQPSKITARSVSTRKLSTKSLPKVKSGKVYI